MASYNPIAKYALAIILGIGLQLMQPSLWQTSTYIMCCIAAGGLMLLYFYSKRHAWLLGLGLLGLAFATTGWRAAHYQQTILPNHLEGKDIVVQGVVHSLPRHAAYGSRFVLQVEHASYKNQSVNLPPRIALTWYAKNRWRKTTNKAQADKRCVQCIQPGSRWQMTVKLKKPHGNRNPYGFDYALWLWSRGIGATGSVRSTKRHAAPKLLLASNNWQPTVWRDALRLRGRNAVYAQLAPTENHPSQAIAGIVAALLMGDQSAITQDDWNVLRITGVAHLMSISGLHISLFAWLAASVVGRLWQYSARLGWSWCLWLPAPQAAWWGGFILASAYAWFSGWGIPAQRTILMLFCVILLRSKGVLWNWHAILSCAACVVLLRDPWALLQAGFWLSFVAVAILFASQLRDKKSANQNISTAASNQAHLFIRTQMVIGLALAPVTLWFFGQTSIVALLANAVALPIVTIVTIPLIFLGLLWQPLWHIAGYSLHILMLILHELAQFSWASYHAAIAPWPVALAAFMGAWLLILRLPWPIRTVGALAIIPMLFWQPSRPKQGEFDILIADVGQGSAILIRTHQHSLLYDAGPKLGADNDAGKRTLIPLLRALGEHPNRLLVSHPDNDHIGGARSLLQAYPNMEFMANLDTKHALRSLRTSIPCRENTSWTWDGVTFSILHPTQEANQNAGKKLFSKNAMSCVLHISNGRNTALLPGDIGKKEEHAIIKRYQDHLPMLQADILLAGHHGSKSSTGAAWLDAVQPQWVVIQNGYRNPYRHPHPSVLKRLAMRNIAALRSDYCGAASWSSHSNTTICERQRKRRYWQYQRSNS